MINRTYIMIGILVISSIVVTGCTLTAQNKSSTKTSQATTNQNTNTTTVPASWKTYRNEDLKFELKYPSDMTFSISSEKQPDNRIFFAQFIKGDGPFKSFAVYNTPSSQVIAQRKSAADKDIDPIIEEKDIQINGRTVHVLTQKTAIGVGNDTTYYWDVNGKTAEFVSTPNDTTTSNETTIEQTVSFF